MSSILDALEKAHRKRRKTETGLAPEELAEAERRERHIRDETARHRRMFLLLAGGIGLLALLLVLAITALVYVAVTARESRPAPEVPQVAIALPSPTEVATPPPTPEPTAVPEDLPAVSAEQAPDPTPQATPTESPTPVPTAVAEPTPTPLPTPTPTPQPTAAPRFAHMQIVYDVELGVKIRGILADGPSSVIMIDDTTVALGRRYGRIRPIRIENRMIEAEYDQDGEEITIFIRW